MLFLLRLALRRDTYGHDDFSSNGRHSAIFKARSEMVTEAEIAVFEAWFGEPFDRFVRRSTCESRRDGRPTMPVP
jgi:hypothetical protein